MVQLNHVGVTTGSVEELSALRAEFERSQCVLLRKFLAPDLADRFSTLLERTSFRSNDYSGIGTSGQPVDPTVSSALHLLVNDVPLFEVLARLTGCPPIGDFIGSVYRMRANENESYGWHDDTVDDRRLALSINLSRHGYSGGLLQIRRKADPDTLLCEHLNTGLGDALIFRVSKDLEHRVSPVNGDHAKLAFAGWFRGRSEYGPYLRRALTLAMSGPVQSSTTS